MNTNAETEIPGFLRSRLRPVTGDFIQGLFGVRSPSHSCLFVFIRGFLLRGYGFVASNVLPLLALALGVSSLSASPETDAKSLLAKMTLEEKIGQMVQVDSAALKDIRDVRTYFIGSVLSGGNSDPADNLPETWLKFVKEFRAQALQTRLKIPLLYGVDAVHGHNNVLGAVIFPHHIGMGAANDPILVEKAERITAQELRATGINWAFAPCIAVARDVRWGRTYESYGQLPGMVGDLGAASVRGFQGKALGRNSVLACAKHFAGDGGTEDGKDRGNTVCDEPAFRDLFVAPYAAAIKAGVASIMVSFNSWDGQKMHGNRRLLSDVLKKEMGFRGFLVSDWAAIDQLGPDYKTDIETAINAGLDMVMIPAGPGETNNYPDFITDLKDLIAAGKVSPERIDDAVLRILRAKYQMGLFEQNEGESAASALNKAIGSPGHRQVARECVRKSLVLLKNSNNVLPLKKAFKRITVVGQAADNIGIQCGGWTIDWQGKPGEITTGGTTLLAAVKKTVGPGTEVTYSRDGGDLKNPDVVIVVVGEKPYAEMEGDRQELQLAPEDTALIARMKASGAPVLTILYSGRPLLLGAALEKSDAFLAAWLPGTEGLGITDVLFGDAMPHGKLPRLWPANNHQFCVDHCDGKPLFPVGFGLTYGHLSRK